MRLLKKWLCALPILSLVSAGSLEAGMGDDFVLLESSGGGCEVSYQPASLAWDTVRVNGRTYQKATLPLASFWETPGDPMIPGRVLIVGIPPTGGVGVSVETSGMTDRSGVRFLPVPELREQNGFPLEIYSEGAAYSASRFFPNRLYDVEEPSFIGSQRVVRIFVYPVRYDPRTETVRVASRMIFRVTFDEPARGSFSKDMRRGKEENVHKKLLVNYEDAKRWRVEREKEGVGRGQVFQAGERYKIPVSQEGMYRITGSFLEDHGVDIASVEPSTLKIYNNGGRELPQSVTADRPDQLMENAIFTVGMEDGRFDATDYLIFYGQGVTGWEVDDATGEYAHYIHRYATRNIYWLVFNDGTEGQRMETVGIAPPDGETSVPYVTDRFFLEPELTNPLNAGVDWVGPSFDNSSPVRTYDIFLPGLVAQEAIQFHFRFRGNTTGNHLFTIFLNGQPFKTVSFSGFSSPETSATLTGVGVEGENTLTFSYGGSNDAAQGYLDWYEVAYARRLEASDNRLRFYSPTEAGLYEYRLDAFGTEPWIFDITDFDGVFRVLPESESGGWRFSSPVTDTPRKYFAVETSALLTPGDMIEDTGLHLRDPNGGADLIIITHADFYDQAQRLENLRENHDSLTVVVTDIQDVYDDFGWGLSDPTAIRDYVKFAYENWNPPPSYLLLLGDGDYDYRDILTAASENRIPPYEFSGSNKDVARASDDWYTYVSGDDSRMDLAVGRLTVQTPAEARAVVDKIVAYEQTLPQGRWKALVTLVGDDEIGQSSNETTHTRAVETIAEDILPSFFNVRKIYLTEYPEVITAEGRRKPQAGEDLVEQINLGTVLVNYVGHGNNHIWADERVFYQERDFGHLENGEKLPLFYAATCDFGRYDDPRVQSFSEELLNAEGRGGVAVIAATRFCSASPNEALNKAFVAALFQDNGVTERLGDALRTAKLGSWSTENNEKYQIMGDPAMRLGIPRYRAVFTSLEPDTFQALGLVRVEGSIQRDGVEWTNFQGRLVLSAYDSKKAVIYTTEAGSQLPYVLPGNTIFRGEASVENGRFEVPFVVPKDISYGGESGRLHAYFYDDDFDGVGNRDAIRVGGSADVVDNQGPDIFLSFTDQPEFMSGGMVAGEPELVADIQDGQTGVNITGEIGHKIILSLDDENAYDVTEYFQYDEGSYLAGQLIYPLSSLEEGEHALGLKVWDNANNSSTQTLVFELVADDDLRVEEVLNYPNPFDESTHFTFKLSHDAEIDIKVFTVDGRLVKRLDTVYAGPGFNLVYWDGRDDMGDKLANGVYLYKVTAKALVLDKALRKEVIGRLMVMR